MLTSSSAGPCNFANPARIVHGWYWALPSRALSRGAVRALTLFGKRIVLFRTERGLAKAVDAHCPHMGASLETGTVEGDGLRCPFHGRKFVEGACVEVPGVKGTHGERAPAAAHAGSLARHRVAEKYGMIWIHTDAASTDPLPSFAELDGGEVDVFVDRAERRLCHPTLILGGGVDEEHFNFVHARTTSLTGPLSFCWERVDERVIRFWNVADMPRRDLRTRLMAKVYGGILRYDVTYWSGSTALARLGPPRAPLFSIFAYRPTADGETEGLNIYITPRRKGFARLLGAVRLLATRTILRKGGGEDAVIQNRIRFRLGPGALSNAPFAAFVEHIDALPSFATEDTQCPH